VHHGGAGTTHAACRAGRPAVVVPQLGDQFFWAERLRRLGAAPRALPLRRLTARRLAAAIAAADRPAVHTAAQRLSREMADEQGVVRAASMLEEISPR